jgi:hypothetical protein
MAPLVSFGSTISQQSNPTKKNPPADFVRFDLAENVHLQGRFKFAFVCFAQLYTV